MKNILKPDQVNKIKDLCTQFNITNYTINPDRSIDVNGSVNLAGLEIRRIPIKFGKVNGNFSCESSRLTSLKNSPREVTGDFDCSYNKLKSLQYCPEWVDGDFGFEQNQVTDLTYFPRYLGGHYTYYANPLKDVYFKFIMDLGDDLPILLKYINHYEVWTPDSDEFNEENYQTLLAEIKDGLR